MKHIYKLKKIVYRLRVQGLIWTVQYYFSRIFMIINGYLLFGYVAYIPLSSRINGTKYISIGKNFHAGRGLWMDAIDTYEYIDGKQEFSPQLLIGDDVSIGEFVHIGCINCVDIGNNVLMGSKIYITDHNHGTYHGSNIDRPDIPPIKRRLSMGQAVKICHNVWIGEFVTILPGVTIGENSIIGTHSTITHDIPSNSIAVGSPAKVIKHWDDNLQEWVKV